MAFDSLSIQTRGSTTAMRKVTLFVRGTNLYEPNEYTSENFRAIHFVTNQIV